MRIAQIAPLWETVPPRSYGGTELVIHLLTEHLHQLGHEVTLFAAHASKTQAHLQVCSDFPLRELPAHYSHCNDAKALSVYPGSQASAYFELRMLEHVYAQAERFDVIHNHLGPMALPFAHQSGTPTLTTLHGPFLETTLIQCLEKQQYQTYAHLPYVSISDNQRQGCPQLNYVQTIHHGLDLSQYPYQPNLPDEPYLAFLGRFCEDKGPHHAIAVAKATGLKLIMAGKVDNPEEKAFFKRAVEPHLDNRQIRYIGELNHPQKTALLSNAVATLCPISWPEPFGLVVIESMACGTPVLAFGHGAIPELIRHGETGFVLDSPEAMIAALENIHTVSRKAVRHHAERSFSAQAMTRQYVEAYQRVRLESLSLHPPKKITRLSHPWESGKAPIVV